MPPAVLNCACPIEVGNSHSLFRFYVTLFRTVTLPDDLVCNFCVIGVLLATCHILVCHPKAMQLSVHELRVLGALIEKEITTPDIYPLSLNAIQAATNQRSSRDPVLDLTEEDLRQALHALEDRALASPARGGLSGAGSRVAKYEHHARTALNLRRDETAILCLLLLRGPQTPGELRSRADRLFAFDDLSSVIATLERLAARPPQAETPESTGPLAVLLPRQPGSREARFAHLLGGPVAHAIPHHPLHATAVPSAEHPDLAASLAALERRLATLEDRLQRLEAITPAIAAEGDIPA